MAALAGVATALEYFGFLDLVAGATQENFIDHLATVTLKLL